MYRYTVNSNIKMSQNQQYPNQRSVRTCSCCGQPGHAINKCNSPQVLRFIEDATAAAITASSVVTLKYRRPFTNTSLPILKANAANIRIEDSVSNLTLDYLTHLLACFYWNKHNPAGSHSHANTHDELLLLQETCRQSATNAVTEEAEARVQQRMFEEQQRQEAAAAAEAQRQLQLFTRQQQRYAIDHVHLENQRQQTRHAFIQARLAVPDCVSRPLVATRPAAANRVTCLCCDSAEHNITACQNYRGIPSMTSILSLVCTRTEFRRRLQQHPNLYVLLAFAIKSNLVPFDCHDCVLAMNEITNYFYNNQAKYVQIRMDLQAYGIEYAYQQETGQALETNIIYDPRVHFFQSLVETTAEINFTNMDNQEFITKCIRLSEMIGVNVNTPIEITLGLKASADDDDDEAKENEENEEQSSCAVCLGEWDIKYPTITFGCNHDMCSRCLNTFFKTRTRPSCHLCRQSICHISVPSEALNAELFQGIGVRIVRQSSA